mmetsp:Transcript_21170/g.44613  ORF Transcript_21170/g.44613 Transcript_21170/m.44613 type:complete len:86 (+) Transcript_21170:151-408(+)
MPKELNYFSELMTLNLYFNKLTGTIPDLSGLIAIEQIDLDGNELTGTVPESIFNMPNIGKSDSPVYYVFEHFWCPKISIEFCPGM